MSRANDKTINWVFAILLCAAVALLLLVAPGCARKGEVASGIPAAAATEARLVCEAFGGLESFDVEDVTTGSGQSGQSYLVRAYCKSGHAIAGRINLEHAAQ